MISSKAFVVISSAAFLCSCAANENILRSANENTVSTNTSVVKSSMEQDLEAMRTADFTVVFVLRRKDGGVFDPEDRAAVRQNTAEANRRVSADDGKAVIVGSNYPIPEKNIAALKERFQFEDHSPPAANTNSNAAN